MIKLKNVSFSYENLPMIKNISLNFQAGKFYSILGPNGCGKTTLLDLMIGHLKPISGEILLQTKNMAINNFNDMGINNTNDIAINNTNIKNILFMSKREIAQHIALVSQNYNINFPFTVKEVVMMGRHPYIGRFANPSINDLEIVKSVMERTSTSNFGMKKITDLSGGERQRCVFARALCQNTPLLFLDEAFSNIDISHTINLLNLVKKEVKERSQTVISVFHDINLAAIWSDIMVFMKNGEIVASGDTSEIMDKSIIEKVFNVKSKVEYNPYAEAKQVYFRG